MIIRDELLNLPKHFSPLGEYATTCITLEIGDQEEVILNLDIDVERGDDEVKLSDAAEQLFKVVKKVHQPRVQNKVDTLLRDMSLY